ncbi:MAG TPA: DUF92 domain-containing protein, partial [Terracidiphilus sp.]
MDTQKLAWQSKLILLAVIPAATILALWSIRAWLENGVIRVPAWSLALSAILGLAAWATQSATLAGAATGAILCFNLMSSFAHNPYRPWDTFLAPVVALLLLTSLATRFGRTRKEQLGISEARHGRGAAQVAANLGPAALMCTPAIPHWLYAQMPHQPHHSFIALAGAAALAALAEAAADTVSSEIGQVLGGQPFLLTSFRRVPAGTDGAISLAGTCAGTAAAMTIAAIGTLVLRGDLFTFALSAAGGI